MDKIKELLEEVESCGFGYDDRLLLRRLEAALPELRELVADEAVKLQRGDVFELLGDGSVWLVERRRESLDVTIKTRKLGGGNHSDYAAGDYCNHWNDSDAKAILATGVPLDTKTWPLEENDGE